MSLISKLNEQAAAQQQLAVVIVKAAHEEVMSCVKEAVEAGMIKALLIDDAEALKQLAAQHQLAESDYDIIDIADDEAAAEKAVELVRTGTAGAIMKGHISTGKLLKAVVNKEHGIRKSSLLSHVAVVDVPALDRLIGLTDGGMVLTPDEQQMPVVIDHAVEVFHQLGVAQPKVAILSAAETLIPKLPSSQIAANVAAASSEQDRIVEGPISIDISLNREIAEDKHYTGKIQGDADIIAVPDIVAGNAFVKSLLLFGDAKMAGVIIGAAVPIILTSRSSSAEEKFASILLAKVLMKEK